MAKPMSISFTWAGGENTLLTNAFVDYKTQKMSNEQDWKFLRTKYSDLIEMHIASLLMMKRQIGDFQDLNPEKRTSRQKRCQLK